MVVKRRSWTKIRSDIAVTRRANPAADTTELLRELKEARLASHIAKVVGEAPELTAAARHRLALQLRGDAV